jgi:hypothetical protein
MKNKKLKDEGIHFKLIDTFGKEKYLGNEKLTPEERDLWNKIVSLKI